MSTYVVYWQHIVDMVSQYEALSWRHISSSPVSCPTCSDRVHKKLVFLVALPADLMGFRSHARPAAVLSGRCSKIWPGLEARVFLPVPFSSLLSLSSSLSHRSLALALKLPISRMDDLILIGASNWTLRISKPNYQCVAGPNWTGNVRGLNGLYISRWVDGPIC